MTVTPRHEWYVNECLERPQGPGRPSARRVQFVPSHSHVSAKGLPQPRPPKSTATPLRSSKVILVSPLSGGCVAGVRLPQPPSRHSHVSGRLLHAVGGWLDSGIEVLAGYMIVHALHVSYAA